MDIDEAELEDFAEGDLLRKMIQKYREEQNPFSTYEMRKMKPMGGSRAKELVDRLLLDGLIYPVPDTTEKYVPDPEDEDLDRKAKVESIAAQFAGRIFEGVKDTGKKYPVLSKLLLHQPLRKIALRKRPLRKILFGTNRPLLDALFGE